MIASNPNEPAPKIPPAEEPLRDPVPPPMRDPPQKPLRDPDPPPYQDPPQRTGE